MVRKRVSVNELLLQDMIAGEASEERIKQEEDRLNNKITSSENDIVHNDSEVKDTDAGKENIKTSKKKKERGGYEELYLGYRPVDKFNRQQIYIDGELYEKFARFLKVVGDRKMSMTSFVNNILSQHWEDNKNTMSELYDKNMNKPL